MKFSVHLPVRWSADPQRCLDGGELAALAGEIEAAGGDACFATDHPAPTRQWLAGGGHATLDPLLALAFAAAGSQRLLLHANALVLPYRNPLLTAKAVASLDVLSGGRVICGVAAGYLEGEFLALGADFRKRGRHCDQALEVMLPAWTGQPLYVTGDGFEARGNQVWPPPAQRPHPPIWVGGNSDAAIRRAVRFGDGWMPFPNASADITTSVTCIDDLQQRIEAARQLAASLQRTRPLEICMVPFGLAITGQVEWDPDGLVSQLRQLSLIGVSWAVLTLGETSRPAFLSQLHRLGEEVLLQVRDC